MTRSEWIAQNYSRFLCDYNWTLDNVESEADKLVERGYLDAGKQLDRGCYESHLHELQTQLAALTAERDKAKKELTEEERAHLNTIEQRDAYHDFLDDFVGALGGVEAHGEHSSGNCPWQNALDYLHTITAERDALQDKCDELEEESVSLSASCHSFDQQVAEQAARIRVLELFVQVLDAARVYENEAGYSVQRDDYEAIQQARAAVGEVGGES